MASSTGWWRRWKFRANRTVPAPRLAAVVFGAGIAAFVFNDWLWASPALPMALIAVLVGVALVDWLRLRKAGVPVLRRDVPAVAQLGQPTTVTYHIVPPAGTADRATVQYRVWSGLEVDSGSPDTMLPAAKPEKTWADGALQVTETYRPERRGTTRFGDADLRWSSPWKLWLRYHRYPGQEEVLVLPDVTSWRRDVEILQRAVLHDGRHVRRYVSGDTDFAHIAEYAFGDDPRHINWAATRRKRRLMKNVMQPERGQIVWIAIDASRYMGVELPGGKTRLDLALECASALALTALAAGDSVGVLAFTNELLLRVPPGKGAKHWRQLVYAFASIEAKPVQGGYHALFESLAQSEGRRSLLVVLSELEGVSVDPRFAGALATIRRRHPTILVTVADVHAERALRTTPETTRDLSELAAAMWVVEQRSETLNRLRRQGLEVLQSPPGELIVDVVRAYLRRRQKYVL
jgi:uncharacterized protein (DUF58 family)